MPVTAIRFYKAEDSRGNPLPFGYLSNFSNHPIESFGVVFKTAEHYYQAHKFVPGSPEWNEVVESKNASDAFRVGRNPNYFNKIVEGWDYMKLDVMYDAVFLKFTNPNNRDIQEMLLSTDDVTLIEASPGDTYWGIGSMGNGLNNLGKILMRVRNRIRTGEELKRL